MTRSSAMHRVAAAIVAATLIASPPTSGGDVPDHPDATSIKEAAARWADAFGRGSVEDIVGMYTADAKLLPEAGDTISGRPGIREFFRKMKAEHPRQTIRFSNFEFFGSAPNVTECSEFEIRDERGEVAERGKQVLVRLKQDGTWRIQRDIWTSNAPAKPE